MSLLPNFIGRRLRGDMQYLAWYFKTRMCLIGTVNLWIVERCGVGDNIWQICLSKVFNSFILTIKI